MTILFCIHLEYAFKHKAFLDLKIEKNIKNIAFDLSGNESIYIIKSLIGAGKKSEYITWQNFLVDGDFTAW